MTRDGFHHYRPQDYRSMPWKNGGGTTTELVIEPAGATLDTDFRWRLSMADVGSSGPFSLFEGCDRTLLLLEGGGLRLEFDQAGPTTLTQSLIPHRFPGDLRASGTLLSGPCRDFNVITRRDVCTHRLEVIPLTSRHRTLPEARVRFIYCVAGPLRVDAFELAPQELLRVEMSGRPLEAWAPESGMAILVAIEPAGQVW